MTHQLVVRHPSCPYPSGSRLETEQRRHERERLVGAEGHIRVRVHPEDLRVVCEGQCLQIGYGGLHGAAGGGVVVPAARELVSLHEDVGDLSSSATRRR